MVSIHDTLAELGNLVGRYINGDRPWSLRRFLISHPDMLDVFHIQMTSALSQFPEMIQSRLIELLREMIFETRIDEARIEMFRAIAGMNDDQLREESSKYNFIQEGQMYNPLIPLLEYAQAIYNSMESRGLNQAILESEPE